MTASTHEPPLRDRIIELMDDGKPRTIRRIKECLGVQRMTLAYDAVVLLAASGVLERIDQINEGTVKAHMFRKAQPKPAAPVGPTTSPFHWKTYQPYVPESRPAPSSQL